MERPSGRQDKAAQAAPASACAREPRELLELHFFMRLAREWELRFEKVFRTGALTKWYSAVGREGTTVAAATAIEAGDALVTVHRDSGAILRYYLDAHQLAPDLFGPSDKRRVPRADSRDLLYRLACQVLGKADGFSGGFERSYHFSLLREEDGLIHAGMISHLGAMVPVAAGIAHAFKLRGSDRVALNFLGEGGTSTGECHEGLNIAAVLRVPLIFVIENDGYAFSTPASKQYAAESLAARAPGYGMPGVRVDGADALAVLAAVKEAVAHARGGGGPTLIEAVLGRLRGHSEGDDSLKLLSEEELRNREERDPLRRFEARLLALGLADRAYLEDIEKRAAALILEAADRALATPDPPPEPERRPVFAP